MQQNVSPAEIEKFSKPKSVWWDKQGPFRTLHLINPLRLRFIAQSVDLFSKKILDVGCGGGILSDAMAKAGGIVTAIDASAEAIGAAKEYAELSDSAVNYQHTTIEAFSEDTDVNEAAFDIITCLEMLEHVPSPGSVIQHISQLLKPGGLVFFSTLNRNPKAFLKAIVGAEYVLQLLPKGTHRYRQFIKPSELAKTVRHFALSVNQLAGIDFDLLTREFQLTEDVSVNYLMCCQKL